MKKFLLEASDVSMRYGRRKLFRSISASFSNGDRVSIVGPNGSGKTTLLKILSGLERPTSGNVSLTIDSKVIDSTDRPLHFGLVGPYLNLYDRFTLRENLSFVARVRGIADRHEKIEEVLHMVQLADRGDELLATYSSGMKQRARWAQALVLTPACLMLDEPFSNLDNIGKECFTHVIDSFTQNGGVLILATNESLEAGLCQRSISIGDYQD